MRLVKSWFLIVAALGMLLSTAAAQEGGMGPKSAKRAMTLALAKQLAAAAAKAVCTPECDPVGGTIVLVDDAGALIYLETLDGTQTPSIDMAIKKAKTAALYHRPTSQFHTAVTKGTNVSYLDGSFPDMTTADGGVPLSVNGYMIGGFGTSGNGPGIAKMIAAVQAELKKITGK